MTLSMLAKIAQLCGVEALTAADGEEALRLAADEQPDLILTDMNMPGMSGLAVLEALRTRQETADIPALVLTASAELDTDEHILAAGGQGYLQKPFRMDDLMRLIQKYT